MYDQDYYQILGIPINATQEKIKEAWHLQITAWHPDRFKGEMRKEAEKRTKFINEAYDVLSDPKKRKDYNLSFFQEEYQEYITQQHKNIQSLIQRSKILRNWGFGIYIVSIITDMMMWDVTEPGMGLFLLMMTGILRVTSFILGFMSWKCGTGLGKWTMFLSGISFIGLIFEIFSWG